MWSRSRYTAECSAVIRFAAVDQIVVLRPGAAACVTFSRIAFAASRGDPPPRPTMPSHDVLPVHFDAVQHILLGRIRRDTGEVDRRGTSRATRSNTGVRARPPSVTSSGRLTPRRSSSAGSSFTAPGPKRIVVGNANVAEVHIDSRYRASSQSVTAFSNWRTSHSRVAA